jgi:hypothetical protein
MKIVANISPEEPEIGIEINHTPKRTMVHTVEMDIKVDNMPTLQYAGRSQKNIVCQPVKTRNN